MKLYPDNTMSGSFANEPVSTLKEKYLEMAKTQGYQAAVNQLHHDLWEMEKECFDSPEGYRPNLWKTLNEMRIFSRELWDSNLSS
jgi:hypothetical protein